MVRVRLLSSNLGPTLPLLAIKTSMGKVRERGIEYYLEEYPRVKRKEMLEWLVKAARNFPSVLEHIVFNFMIEDVSRVLTHQLVRHRLASYTQESQRYSAPIGLSEKERQILGDKDTPPEKAAMILEKYFVIPPSIRRDEGPLRLFLETLVEALDNYKRLIEKGVPGEDARFLLPQAVKTRVMMTLNLRELLHMVSLRRKKAAQWEIRELAEKLIQETKRVIPNIEEILEAYGDK